MLSSSLWPWEWAHCVRLCVCFYTGLCLLSGLYRLDLLSSQMHWNVHALYVLVQSEWAHSNSWKPVACIQCDGNVNLILHSLFFHRLWCDKWRQQPMIALSKNSAKLCHLHPGMTAFTASIQDRMARKMHYGMVGRRLYGREAAFASSFLYIL